MAKIDWFIRANLKLRHLQLLVALDELHSIGRVANIMSITQPAVSKMLSALESGLGVRLFERSQNGMAPTEAGSIFIQYAREILLQLNSAQDDLRGLTEGRIRRIALGVMPAAALVLVPRFIVELEKRCTGVAISAQEGPVETLLPALQNGDLDIMVGVLPNHWVSFDVRVEILYKDNFVIAVRKGHPLTQFKKPGWPDLRDYPMIMPPKNALTHGMLSDVLARHKIDKPRRGLESISTLTNIGVLRQSDAIALMPFEVAHDFEKIDVLSILPMDIPDVYRNVGVMWLARRDDPAIHAVIDLFRDTSARMVAERS